MDFTNLYGSGSGKILFESANKCSNVIIIDCKMQYISFALIFCIRCEGNVVWGTCAGMILLSNSVVGEKRGSQIKVCKMLLCNVIKRSSLLNYSSLIIES